MHSLRRSRVHCTLVFELIWCMFWLMPKIYSMEFATGKNDFQKCLIIIYINVLSLSFNFMINANWNYIILTCITFCLIIATVLFTFDKQTSSVGIYYRKMNNSTATTVNHLSHIKALPYIYTNHIQIILSKT